MTGRRFHFASPRTPNPATHMVAKLAKDATRLVTAPTVRLT